MPTTIEQDFFREIKKATRKAGQVIGKEVVRAWKDDAKANLEHPKGFASRIGYSVGKGGNLVIYAASNAAENFEEGGIIRASNGSLRVMVPFNYGGSGRMSQGDLMEETRAGNMFVLKWRGKALLMLKDEDNSKGWRGLKNIKKTAKNARQNHPGAHLVAVLQRDVHIRKRLHLRDKAASFRIKYVNAIEEALIG